MLPTEILLTIINYLANDRPALLRLILVSRRFNALALPPLYEEITFTIYSPHLQKRLASVESFCRNIETISGVRFTTALSFDHKCSVNHQENISRAHRLITRILPYLPNLRKLAVNFMPSAAVDPEILQLLPSTVYLTHLHLGCGSYPASFLQHIVLFPTLEHISIPDFRSKDIEAQINNKISSKELPKLRSLIMSVENSLLFDNLTSLVGLAITSDDIRSSFVGLDFATRHLCRAFASIRFLALQFVAMSTMEILLPRLPNLEYISIDAPSSPSQAHDLGILFSKNTNANLKGIQFEYSDCDIVPFAQALLDSVKHLVIIDWTSSKDLSAWRLCRGSTTAIPITSSADQWQDWWEPMYQVVEDADLLIHGDAICDALLHHPLRPDASLQWANEFVKSKYADEISALVDRDNGLHFSASTASAQQISDFRIEEMAKKMQVLAPHVWNLLDTLLSALRKPNFTADSEGDLVMDPPVDVDEDLEYYGDTDIEGIINLLDEATVKTPEERRIYRLDAILTVKKVVIISIMMQSSNQRANALESVIGIFLHTCRTPEKVIAALARMGLSISIQSIHNAITSLSRESANTLQEMGRSLLVAYAYDNFDVNLKSSVPTIDKATDSLKHLTSGLLFPLQHGVTTEDLQCSEELWSKSSLNPSASNLPPGRTWKDLLEIHPDPGDNQGLSRRERFNSWKFIETICSHGPAYFRQFRSDIGEPEVVEAIPVTHTQIIPTRAMDAENSSVAGNIKTINELLAQGGIGDNEDSEAKYEVKDIGDHVLLFHGDLGTGDRLHTALLQRSIERSPWNRLQYVIFVMGLFHLKMAAVDAIWRIFIQSPHARLDETALIEDVAKIWPKETGIIGSNPPFRRMMQVIMFVGICRRLECWRILVKKTLKFNTLEEFAASKPTLETMRKLADQLSLDYVASGGLDRARRTKSDKERDKQLENNLLMNKYFLLFEELSYAMDHGDIGRVELCMLPWILIFKATGKHKYATHVMRYLSNVHFVYPKGLSHAVRYNILVNPTGKPGKFRAVDWCVELNNLYTKAVYGGDGSNFTVERILKESPLIHIYRDAKTTMGENLNVDSLTSSHSYPDMRKTFAEVGKQLEVTSAYVYIAGRTTKLVIEDMVGKGLASLEADAAKDERSRMEEGAGGDDTVDERGEPDEEPRLELADLLA
ncbi:hypothetical protein EYR36_011614 [Pleurotus pulmonarius]|nr:hypothetical protein EYR36_011614 [Pleurotus pulmonarius]